MANRYNNLSRVLTTIDRARGVSVTNGSKSFEGWAALWSISDSNTALRDVKVTRMIGLLHGEIDIALRKVQGTGFSPPLYVSAFDDARKALDIELLAHAWPTWAQRLPPESVVSLRFCAEALPDDGVPISEELLKDIRERVAQLRFEILDGGLPDLAKQYLADLLDVLADAIRNYDIVGDRAFSEAYASTIASMAQSDDVLQQIASTNELASLCEVWSRVSDECKSVRNINECLTSAERKPLLLLPRRK